MTNQEPSYNMSRLVGKYTSNTKNNNPSKHSQCCKCLCKAAIICSL